MKNKGMYRLLSGVLCTSVLLSSQAYAAASADYSDFPQNWSKDAMEFAVKNNFITGVSEDKIAPKAALTRAQLAAILSRAMKTGAGDVSVLDNFTDADKNAWYAGSMAKADIGSSPRRHSALRRKASSRFRPRRHVFVFSMKNPRFLKNKGQPYLLSLSSKSSSVR